MSEECLNKCLNTSEMSKPEDKVTEFFNHAEAVQVEEGTWYYHESSVESELKSLHKQLAKANERIAKLEEERGARYEKWQLKYQLLKDSMKLINCYECGTPVHELSPRSRCCMCEYGRGEFNAKENEQLRKEQE